MKHAILITAHNNPEILSKVLSLYDDEEIDFFILIDKKVRRSNFEIMKSTCKKSKVTFVKQIKVYWSHFSQIKAELILLKSALEGNYDYYHFISGVDFPLKRKSEFIDFFNEYQGYEFVEFTDDEIFIKEKVDERIKYHYLFLKNLRSGKNKVFIRKTQTFLRLAILKIESKCGIDRRKDMKEEIKYGSNWFSITNEFATYVVSKEKWIHKYFSYSSCADELFLQTLIYNSKFMKKNYYTSVESKVITLGRYVDWNRGEPYVFRIEDFNELIQSKSSLFARKFDWKKDKDVVLKLYDYFREEDT